MLLVFGISINAPAFDLGGLANAAKNVMDKKKAKDDQEANQKERAEKEEKFPIWNKLFFYTIQKTPAFTADKVVLQYWIAQPESNYDTVKDNEFEFESEKKKRTDELKEKVGSFKLQDFTIDISGSLGKYNFASKSIPIEDAVGEDNLLLTTARDGQFMTQKPTMSVTPNPVPQEEDWVTVPTGYIFQVTNPKIFSSIDISEDLAKKIAAVQGSRSVKADVVFEVVGVDLKNKKLNKHGTVGIIKIKIKEVKATWTNGPEGDLLIGSNK